ncbi:MAG: hypothetical protein EX272_03380 [Chromatiales bacterium]|nr:MAG: hypothetical protein EX272_03380 [Chromatiales bacterium]
MRILISVPCGIALILVSAGLTACASTSSTEATLARDDPNRVICRNDVNVGSRLKKKTCRPKWEWDEIAEQTAELHRSLERDTAEGSISSESRP